MPLLAIGNQQYWTRALQPSGPPPQPPGGSAKGGYPSWQAAVVAFNFLLFFLIGH